MKTNIERVLEYLWSVNPNGATNAQIRESTGVEPHQQVFMITQKLMSSRKIQGQRVGREWIFCMSESPEMLLQSPSHAAPGTSLPKLNSAIFEDIAREVFSQKFNSQLLHGKVIGVPKLFDMVSADGEIIGDAKYFTLVNGHSLPLAKFSNIAEHVWLLEKTQAKNKFLVFGNDIEVPKLWLSRYGHLRRNVVFYFMTDEGKVEDLD